MTDFEANMPEFHVAVPTPEDMDDRGSKLLCTAILLLTARDYFDVVDDPDEPIRYEPDKAPMTDLTRKELIEWFLKSELYDAITDIPPSYFVKKIKELRDDGKGFPKVNNLVLVGPEPGLRVMQSSGKHYVGRPSNSMNGINSLI